MGYMTKPVNTLIEKISDAVGGLFKPYQIKRIARAVAEADKIHAVAQMEITIFQIRTMVRFFAKEANKQSNIEAITRKALPDAAEQAGHDQVEND